MTDVGLTGYGVYVPEDVVTGAEIAAESGIPEDVVVEKMGLREKRVCPPDTDHVSDMCVNAGREAIADAAIDPAEIDLVVYHGSEYKDHVVWSVAADVAGRLGAANAYATEYYALCASAPVAIRAVRAQLVAEPIDTALLVTATREEDLVDYENERSSFMFNFGSGASAAVLEADPGDGHGEHQRGDADEVSDPGDGEGASEAGDRARATVHQSAAITDGDFSRDVIVPAGGSVEPPSHESVEAGRHTLDVPDQEGMKERLGPVSLPNFLSVADDALARSGFDRADVDFAAVTHMKRSFHETLLEELGLDPGADGYYLDEYGHVQSADQLLAVDEALERDRLAPGDLVLFLAAGTGYTWAATALTWHG